MITDLYHDVKTNPAYNKTVGSGYLIAEYKCPIPTERFRLLTEQNFIIYTVSGQKDWVASGKVYPARAGDALFVKKGVYTTHQYFDVDHCVLILFMSDEFIREFMLAHDTNASPANGAETDGPIIPIHMNETLEMLFKSLFGYLKMAPEIPYGLLELKFRELLYNIVLSPQNKGLSGFLASLRYPGRSALQQVMLDNFQHDLSLEGFARLCGRSLSAFKRDFKNLYGMPPAKWLTGQRLELAKHLLLNSGMNVNEVSFESGFKNAAHFSKAFKEKYSLPPHRFRSRSV